MGNSVVVLGSQWGDEGKGKLVDLLGENAYAVVRFQGGHNAGHTVVVGKQRLALHLIPSAVLHQHVVPLIGNGVVVSLPALLDEVEGLERQGISIRDRLRLSIGCHVVLPSHVALDQGRELKRGIAAIGTTGRGIGPAYEDKIARCGIRIEDLLHPDRLQSKLRDLLDYHNFILEHYLKLKPVDPQVIFDDCMTKAESIKPMIADVSRLLEQYAGQGYNLLFEGAQGCLLDIDHGTYPYVTSSNTTAGGIVNGTGFGVNPNSYRLGVTKAYVTRVGGGPMPTELQDEVGKHLGSRGHEFGTTTGRPRRCGWLDVVALKKAVQLNGLTGLCITKLDVLDALPSVKLCIAYQSPDGQHIDVAPSDSVVFNECTPVYETLLGWDESTAGVTDYGRLPKNAKKYLDRLEALLGIPIDMLSTGPDRDATIMRRNPWSG